MAPPSFNVIVIGAGEIYRFLVTQSFLAVEKLTSDGAEIGISGIAAARFYLDVHPDCRLVILEKDQCLGGVWSTSTTSFFSMHDKRSLPGDVCETT